MKLFDLIETAFNNKIINEEEKDQLLEEYVSLVNDALYLNALIAAKNLIWEKINEAEKMLDEWEKNK